MISSDVAARWTHTFINTTHSGPNEVILIDFTLAVIQHYLLAYIKMDELLLFRLIWSSFFTHEF